MGPVSNITLQWEKNVGNVELRSIPHASAGVEHDDKLDTSKQSNFVSEDLNEEAFDKAPQFARIYFANLRLIFGEKAKFVKAQIDSASTRNIILSSLLRKLFPNSSD